ncbi:hypothetical protein ACOME3_009038 [Neoechinorhynchus agilis]
MIFSAPLYSVAARPLTKFVAGSTQIRCIASSLGRIDALKSLINQTKDIYKRVSPCVQTDWVHKYINDFFDVESNMRTKKTFREAIKSYSQTYPQRQYVVEFLYAAMDNLKNFNVNHDYQVYDELLRLLPDGRYLLLIDFATLFRIGLDGRYRAANLIMADMHCYPKQQQAALLVLQLLLIERLIPTQEMSDHLTKVFEFGPCSRERCGSEGELRLYQNCTAYWQPKFSEINKYAPALTRKRLFNSVLDPRSHPILLKTIEALDKMCSSVDPSTDFNFVKVHEGDAWLVCTQSPTQKALLESILSLDEADCRIWIEGPNLVWVGRDPVHYFVLKSALPTQTEGYRGFMGSLDTNKSIADQRRLSAASHTFAPRDTSATLKRNHQSIHLQHSPQGDDTLEVVCSVCSFYAPDIQSISDGKSRHLVKWLDFLSREAPNRDRICAIDQDPS